MEIKTVEEALALDRAGKLVGMFEMPSNIYHHTNCPGVSRSRLLLLKESVTLARFEYLLANPEPLSRELIMGDAVHTLVLEPNLYDKRFAVSKQRRGSKAFEEISELNPGKEILVGDEPLEALTMAEAIKKDELASMILDGVHERSFFWRDEETGLLCKTRSDSLHPTKGIDADLKTSKNAEEDEFMKSVFDYGYHVQVASRLHGIEQAIKQSGLKIEWKVPDKFVFVVIDKRPPYQIGYYDLEPAFIDEGMKVYKALLKRYAEYLALKKASQKMPGLEPRIRTLVSKSYMYEKETNN